MSAAQSLWRCGVAAVLLAAVTTITNAAGRPVTATAAGGPACPGQSPHNTPVSAADFMPVNGTVPRPVVLVHGWDSGYTAMAGYAKLLDSSKVLHQPLHAFLFDYSANSGRWAAIPAIASCLADYVNAVSAAYRTAGGDGKVLAVGHSMGGLAIRFSASGQYAANPDGANLGGVVTIDTPHLGSPWGNTPDAQLGQDFTQFGNGNGLEGLLPWPPGSDGQVCLATHSGSAGMPAGCATPSWLPASVPVAQIAGDITVHRQLFGFDVADSDIKGDAVVSTASSLGYLPGSGPGAPPAGTAAPADYVDACEVTSGQLEAGAGGLGISVLNSLESAFEYVFSLGDRPLSSPVLTLLTLADITAPCGHTHVNNPVTDPFASLDVLKALNADLDRLQGNVPARYVGRWLSPVAGVEFVINADGSAQLVWGDNRTSAIKFHSISGGIEGTVTSTNEPYVGVGPGTLITLTPAAYGGLVVDMHGAADITVVYQETKLPAATLAPYVGDNWYVHGATLAINPDSTGVMKWNAGPCGSEMCTGTSTIMFDSTVGNGIIGVITSDNFTQSDGQPAPSDFVLNYDDPQPGYVFELQPAGPKLLYTTWLGQLPASLNSGNRNWCWIGASYPPGTCGA